MMPSQDDAGRIKICSELLIGNIVDVFLKEKVAKLILVSIQQIEIY